MNALEQFNYEFTEDDMQPLNDDDIEDVSGGRIKITGYGMLAALMAQVKLLGKDKEHCIEILRHGWETDCEFKVKLTDGTDEDLEKAIAFIEKNWSF